MINNTSMYKGDLEGFPKEVVDKMLDRQEEQGNKRDVSVFEKNVSVGFQWSDTKEGYSFWRDVIDFKNFGVFFDRYPKVEDNANSTFITYHKEKPKQYANKLIEGMDVIDMVKHFDLNFNEGNILKYLLRDKGQDISDLNKIIDYAKRELEYLEKNPKVETCA